MYVRDPRVISAEKRGRSCRGVAISHPWRPDLRIRSDATEQHGLANSKRCIVPHCKARGRSILLKKAKTLGRAPGMAGKLTVNSTDLVSNPVKRIAGTNRGMVAYFMCATFWCTTFGPATMANATYEVIPYEGGGVWITMAMWLVLSYPKKQRLKRLSVRP